jgi:hypothetical protein
MGSTPPSDFADVNVIERIGDRDRSLVKATIPRLVAAD